MSSKSGAVLVVYLFYFFPLYPLEPGCQNIVPNIRATKIVNRNMTAVYGGFLQYGHRSVLFPEVSYALCEERLRILCREV